MDFNTIQIIETHFKEHPIIDYRNYEPGTFDISAVDCHCQPDFIQNNKFDLEAYCRCLIRKLFNLSREELKTFVEYQCAQVNDALYWLNKLELLIELNHPVFVKDHHRQYKLIAVIETVREKVQHCSPIHYEPTFDFIKLKKEIENISSIKERIKVLKKSHKEFIQYNLLNDNKLNDKFLTAVEIEINYQADLQAVDSPTESPINSPTALQTVDPLRITCNINQLVDVFYQLKYELKYEGKPIIDNSFKEIVLFITKCFVDRSAVPLTYETVRTFLNPAKEEKRPGPNKRLDISNSFKKL